MSILPGPLQPEFVVPVRVPSISQIDLFSHLQMVIITSYLKPCNYVQIIYISSGYLMNRIISVGLEYLKSFNSVPANDQY